MPSSSRQPARWSAQAGCRARRRSSGCGPPASRTCASGPPSPWRRRPTGAGQPRSPVVARNCTELGRFLADPERQTWILKAAEADRSHVEDSIRRAQADLDLTTDRRGRPYSLVCTKNQASYERRARQRRQDLKDLALLAG